MATAVQLANTINYTLGITVNYPKQKESAKPRMTDKEREAKARAKAAKASMKAKSQTERVNKVYFFKMYKTLKLRHLHTYKSLESIYKHIHSYLYLQ